eukprot:scaffold6997_cov134-Skeletonema_marinoi.AAC.1
MESESEHLREIPTEMSLGCLSEEWMATQRVMMMGTCWDLLMELRLEHLKENDLEQLTVIPKEMSLAGLLAEMMAMRMVLMMENG